jgi:pimeloyl-ACP methyl ester carboxylesterase
MFFSPPQMPPSRPIVTVWIHGTKVDECIPAPFAKIAKNIGNIIFQHKLGLHHANEFNQHHYDAIRAKILATTNPVIFQSEYLYSFGWSGELNPRARKNASIELFNNLRQLHKTIQEKTGQDPEFILISHSHGGNVILHMAELYDPEDVVFSIAKVILLACPVQKSTAHLISSPMFERIYSLHSHTDMIQIVDMQGLHSKKKVHRPLFSQRHFDVHPKLVQVAVRWKNCPTWHDEDRIVDEVMLKHLTNSIKLINLLKKNRGLFHIEFQLLPFLRHLTDIIVYLDDLFEKNAHCSSHKDHDIIIEL